MACFFSLESRNPGCSDKENIRPDSDNRQKMGTPRIRTEKTAHGKKRRMTMGGTGLG